MLLQSFGGIRISIHALREEGDFFRECVILVVHKFLSTPSARRATTRLYALADKEIYFYPRPPRGGRPLLSLELETDDLIFLSTPSARRATWSHHLRPTTHQQFLSTPSARRATVWPSKISSAKGYFYPRPPRGGRRSWPPPPSAPSGHFYPRPPRGGRPFQSLKVAVINYISIHALREEGDRP